MTEAEWLQPNYPNALYHTLACPNEMLSFLEGKVSERKLRLFACECVRPLANKLSVPSVDLAAMLQAAEQFADGLISEEEFTSHFNYDMINFAPDWFYEEKAPGQNTYQSFNKLGWLRPTEPVTQDFLKFDE